MTTLPTLSKRLAEASGADRELNDAIFDHFFPPRVDPDVNLPEGFGDGPGMEFGRWTPDYTASVDAVIALAEECLPEVFWSLGTNSFREGVAPYCADFAVKGEVERDGPTPAITLLRALVAALISQQQEGGGE